MKKTLTLNLSDDEMQQLTAYSERFDMSKTATLRQALRFFLAVRSRSDKGEEIYLQDHLGNKREVIIL